MSADTSSENRRKFRNLLCATRVHIAGKEEHACNARGSFRSKNQCCACAVAPAHQTHLFKLQCIHYRGNVGCHQLVRERSRVARAAAVATAVYQNGTIAILDQCWDLIPPIATMAKAAMQQNHE